MRVKQISVSVIAITLGACALTSQAANNDAGHNWMPKAPSNAYWQAPNWSAPSAQPSYRATQPPVYRQSTPPAYNNRYQRPAAPAYRPPYPANQYPAPNVNRSMPAAPGTSKGYQPTPPPPAGPYRASPNMGPYGRDNGASAFNTPGYHPYRNQRRNTSKFWGRSGPGTWMNPNKRNMERGWDDMINAPSRMGEMPGGWTAPEVTMPNPVDMGDQMQDNMEDLPEQMRNMDVGNEVK